MKEMLTENYFLFLDHPSSQKRVFEQLSKLAEIETGISSRQNHKAKVLPRHFLQHCQQQSCLMHRP
jgi:hypothetical protein